LFVDEHCQLCICCLVCLFFCCHSVSPFKKTYIKAEVFYFDIVAKKTKKFLVVSWQSNTPFDVPSDNVNDTIVSNNQASIEYLKLAVVGSGHLVTEEHYHVDQVLHKFKSHIPLEHDCLEIWSEFV
jgi:hypothetical protein